MNREREERERVTVWSSILYQEDEGGHRKCPDTDELSIGEPIECAGIEKEEDCHSRPGRCPARGELFSEKKG